MFLNYIKLCYLLKSTSSFFSKLTTIFNFVIFNNHYGIFDFTGNTNASGILFYLFLIFNAIPIIMNSIILGKLPYLLSLFNGNNNAFSNSPNSNYNSYSLFPNSYAISCFTIFLLCFKHSSYSNKYYFLIEIICCCFFFFNLINDYFICSQGTTGVKFFFNFQHLFFLVLLVFNLIVLYYFPFVYEIEASASTEGSIVTAISFQGFLIRESLLMDAGVEGYYGLDLFIDEYKNIANDFIEITSDNKIYSLKECSKSKDEKERTDSCDTKETSNNSGDKSISDKINEINEIKESLFKNYRRSNRDEFSTKEYRKIYPKYN